MNQAIQMLQKRVQKLTRERDDITDVAEALERMLNETVSVACAWAFVEGQGGSHLTTSEVVSLLDERYGVER
jgi:hypothetical protein